MSRRHFGSVRKRSSGRWQATYWHEGRHHSAPETFRAKADALAYLSTVETDIRRGSWIDPRAGDVLLVDYAEQWLDGRHDLRPRTRDLYRGLLDRQIVPVLGFKALSDLKPSAIRAWHATIAKDHPSTAAKAYRLLSTICRTAVADELIVRSPCRVEGAAVEHAAERPTLTIAEANALAEAMPEQLRALVLLATWCGLRRGELMALRRRDIDELRHEVHVERAADHSKGTPSFGPPKTSAGIRTVAYPVSIAVPLAEHLRRYVGPSPDALLFTGDKGAPLRLAAVYGAWRSACRAIGRPELHLHDLRHASATWAAVVGATTKELMARLGHASPAAALRYQHATADRDRVIADALADLVSVAPVEPLNGQRRSSDFGG